MKKIRIKGKIYTVIEEIPSKESFVTYIAKIRNRSKEEFTLMESYGKYTLYDSKQTKVLTTYSIKEITA